MAAGRRRMAERDGKGDHRLLRMDSNVDASVPTGHAAAWAVIRRPFAGVAVLALAALATQPLWRDGIAGAVDMIDAIYRLFALHTSWQRGLFYPRLAPNLAFGYGAPLFQYYAPLSTFVAQALHLLLGLGYISSIKASLFLATLASGLGMYLYGRTLWHSQAGAVLASIAYVYSPYGFTDLYARGATAEFLALALLPWTLLCAHRLYQEGGTRWFLGLTGALAALVLTHNLTALFFLPVLVGYIVMLYVRERPGHRLGMMVASLALALGLSAFYWWPALAEQGYVDIDHMTEGLYDPSANLTPVRELIQPSLLYRYWEPGAVRVGLVAAVCIVAGLASTLFGRRSERSFRIFFALVVLIALCLQLPAAAAFWAKVPLARFIQFPWRLLSLFSLGSAILIGGLPCALSDARKGPVAGALVAVIVGLALIIAGVGTLWPEYSRIWREGHWKESDVGLADMNARGRAGFELFTNFAPISLQVDMTEVSQSRPQPASSAAALDGRDVTVLVTAHGLLSMSLNVTTAKAFPLSLHAFDFPGWRATIDGRSVPTFAWGELGLVAVQVPAGQHQVELRFGDTALQRAAKWLAGACLAICLSIAARPLWRRRWAVGLLLSAGLVALSAWLARPPLSQGTVIPATVNLNDEAQLVGYGLDQASYRPGETLRLTLFWFGTAPIHQDYAVFVHVRDMQDSGMWGQHDGDSVDGFTPTTRWEPGELIIDDHDVSLPADIAPGRYRIVVGMYDRGTMHNVAVVSADQVLPENRAVLGEFDVEPASGG